MVDLPTLRLGTRPGLDIVPSCPKTASLVAAGTDRVPHHASQLGNVPKCASVLSDFVSSFW
jgi:hypothetical protein